MSTPYLAKEECGLFAVVLSDGTRMPLGAKEISKEMVEELASKLQDHFEQECEARLESEREELEIELEEKREQISILRDECERLEDEVGMIKNAVGSLYRFGQTYHEAYTVEGLGVLLPRPEIAVALASFDRKILYARGTFSGFAIVLDDHKLHPMNFPHFIGYHKTNPRTATPLEFQGQHFTHVEGPELELYGSVLVADLDRPICFDVPGWRVRVTDFEVVIQGAIALVDIIDYEVERREVTPE